MASSAHPGQRAAFWGLGLGLLSLAFLSIHLTKYGSVVPAPRQGAVFGALAAAWLAAAFFQRLPRLLRTADLRTGLGLLFKVNLISLFMLSLTVSLLQLMHWSRLMVYGSGLCFWVLQSAAFAAYRIAVPTTAAPRARRPGVLSLHDLSYPLAVVDLLLLAAAFLAAAALKHGPDFRLDSCGDIVALAGGVWLASAMATCKFARSNFDTFHAAVSAAVKSTALLAGLLAVMRYGLLLGPVSRLQFFGALGIYFVLETLVFVLFARYRGSRGGGDIEAADQARAFLQSRRQALVPEAMDAVCDPARDKLRHALEFLYPALFPFLDRHLDLAGIDRCRCALMSTKDFFTLETLNAGRMRLIVNLHKLNDMRWFNRYFLLAHSRLQPGGMLVGMAHTVDTHRGLYATRFRRPLDSLFYGASFAWRRVFPKLPWLKKLYFALTKGENRMVSRAEVLGRLYFCGFEVVAETEIDHRFFFVARKVKTPSEDRRPTYGPLVRLQRTGLGGRPITVYKFRTMFPFSEYLQEYVYQRNDLAEGGKFMDDFRVTGWGRVMRRLWLDELPMLYNWLRGDLQLVGVRPLSRQYLALYDPALRTLRSRVKPGLLPPFYADMPKSLGEIQASERRYLEAYLTRPTWTQLNYFRRCCWNIVVLQKRSA